MCYCIMCHAMHANLGNKLFNTAIYMNDMTTCMNEMQHGLLEQNTRFIHSSVIYCWKIQFQCHYAGACSRVRPASRSVVIELRI